MTGKHVGQPQWMDLTVDDAETVRDFYAEVLGWTHQPVDMDGYQDFVMMAPDSAPSLSTTPPFVAAGICHARGPNADLPPQWLVYFGVDDLGRACQAATRLGGTLVSDIRTMGELRYAIIKDPAGAACGIMENNAP
ncbi:VOC family protein [Parvularcula sp. LCG005]|uniref:VOC family protein n=1 Tax=Parvularcula sp. LCG005 TaxID=3078805 RepID=UPI002941DCFE|nr:VOC family protein [Parvularcula sp. LCG005]WOI52632.1 VOC family protein [Parvularcula sp. LCG005]